ncbi:hypothetical protein Tco_0189978, partial [Tanacetum coccineum]
MDLLSFIRTTDPTKVMIGERQRAEDEPKLLDTIVGHVVPLPPIASARAESELDASMDKLFDESGSGNQAEQGDSTSGRHGVGIRLVSEVAGTVVEDVTPIQPKCGPAVGSKSRLMVQCLLVEAVQNAKVRGEAMPSLPFVTSSVSTTPEHEDGDHIKSLAGADLRTIGAPQRFVISSDSSHHSSVNVAEVEVNFVVRTSMPIMTSVTTTIPTADPVVIAKEKLVDSSVFGADSSSAGGSHPFPSGFSDSTGSDFLIGGIRTMSLSAEVRMRAEYSIKEKRRLKSVVDGQTELLKVLKERTTTLEKEKSKLEIKVADLVASVKVREQEVADLDAVVTSVKSQNDSLVDQ